MDPVLAVSAVVLPDRSPVPDFLADVRGVERAGMRTAWTYDHLSWPLLIDGPWYGAVPLLAAAAVATERVRLGTLVASPNFRHPVTFAKELMTLDRLSGGRIEAGVGAGTEGPDARVLGDPPRSRAERTARFAEWLELLDRLLREPVTTVAGERFAAVEARQLPGCVQQPRPPLVVGAAGPRAMALAARFGQGWVTYGPYAGGDEPDEWFAAVEAQSRLFGDALAAEGRDPADVRRLVLIGLATAWPFESAERYAETVGRLRECGIDEIALHWPRPDGRGVPPRALSFVAAAHGL